MKLITMQLLTLHLKLLDPCWMASRMIALIEANYGSRICTRALMTNAEASWVRCTNRNDPHVPRKFAGRKGSIRSC